MVPKPNFCLGRACAHTSSQLPAMLTQINPHQHAWNCPGMQTCGDFTPVRTNKVTQILFLVQPHELSAERGPKARHRQDGASSDRSAWCWTKMSQDESVAFQNKLAFPSRTDCLYVRGCMEKQGQLFTTRQVFLPPAADRWLGYT